MSRFQVTLIRPRGYLHTDAFREIAETLQLGLQSLGHTARIEENSFDSGSTNLVLGAHLLSPDENRMVPPGSIIYNLEQLSGSNLVPAYYELACQHQIWDYNQKNIESWMGMNPANSPIHVPVGYVPELCRIENSQHQDIDVLFYGSLNQRRNRVMAALKEAGVKVHTVFGIYGKERDALIARSRIVLNTHFYDSKLFEIVRVSYLLANSKAVVTECSSPEEIEADLRDAVLPVPYETIVAGCQALLQNAEKRRQLEQEGFRLFSQRSETAILKVALEQTGKPALKPVSPALPRKLNLGCGADRHPGYINLDIDSSWQPDILADLNQPFPVDVAIPTSRFGAVTLSQASFNEIVVYDVLQYIRDLDGFMKTCLDLLEEGGLLRVRVPYDLSLLAWQDPRHVRAFNENSWHCYTDGFWRLGWKSARFTLLQCQVVLSDYGKDLQKKGLGTEDIARHPRAVDWMVATLRKRSVNQADRTAAAKLNPAYEAAAEPALATC